MTLGEVVHGTHKGHHIPWVVARLAHTVALRNQSLGVVEVDQRSHAWDTLSIVADHLFLDKKDSRLEQVVDKCCLDGCVQTLIPV